MTEAHPQAPSPTLSLDPSLIDRLRDDLTAADWTVESVNSILSPMARNAMERDQLTPASVELANKTTPAATLSKLFILAENVDADEASRALPSLALAGAIQLGLIQWVASEDSHANTASEDSKSITTTQSHETPSNTKRSGGPGTVRAIMDLRPHAAQLPQGEHVVGHHWWITSDLSQAQTGRPPRDDYVLGIASASTNLLRVTMREPVDSALDLGCGCGILSLYLATHSRRVVATDISERACNVTRFNAILNQADIDVRQGSLFDPVRDERFDLITSNPPFVITPETVRVDAGLIYRDGGMKRDSLIPKVIKQSVHHLNLSGTLQMLANWEVAEHEEDWAVRPTEWIERAAAPVITAGNSIEAWLVQRDLVDVAQYAEWWIRDAKGDRVGRDEWNKEYREWLSDFASAGTKYVGLGFLALRIGSGKDCTDTSAFGCPESLDLNNHGATPMEQARAEDVLAAKRSSGSSQSEMPVADLVMGAADARLGTLTLVSEHLPEGPPADGSAVRTALDNLVVPTGWTTRPLTRTEDVREVRYLIPGSPDPELVRVTQGRPGGRDRTVSSAVAALIGVSDGELTPSQVIPAIAVLLGRDESDVYKEIELALPELLRSGVLRDSSTPDNRA